MRYRTTQSPTGGPAIYRDIDDHPLIDDVTHDERTGEAVAALSDSAVKHSLVVVALVSAEKECRPTELAPLYDFVDPESIDRLFEEPLGHSELVIAFEYEGYDVTVSAETVAVSPLQ